jgi:uncharacterized protein involved in exopolysaccharide biosynthesis
MSKTASNVLLVAIIALFVGTVSYVISARKPEQYSATTRLFFNKGAPTALLFLGPQFGQPDVEEQVALSTAAIDVNSFDVAERTAKDFPILKMGPGEVASSIDALPVRETLIVEVTARTDNGFVAATLAEAYVKTYFNVRRDRDAAQARSVQRALQARLARLPTLERRGPRGEALREQIASYNTLIRVGTAGPVVIEHARPSSVAESPKPGRDAVFGGLFGVAVGAGLVALRRSGSKTRSDVEEARRVSARGGYYGPPGGYQGPPGP